MKSKLYDLSNAQKRIYMTDQMFLNKPVNNLIGYVIFTGKVNISALMTAVQQTIQSMDSCSIRLIIQQDNVMQYFDEDTNPIIGLNDFSGEEFPDIAFEKYIENLKKHLFALYDSVLYKIDVLKIDENRCGYAINFHHIISDGWTMKLLVERVGQFYSAACKREEMKTDAGRYMEYLKDEALYLKSDKAEKNKKLWLEQLNEHKWECVNALGHNRSEGERITKILSRKSKDALFKVATKFGGISVALATIFNLIIYYTNKKYASFISIPNYNRVNHRAKNTTGMFTSTVILREYIEDDMSLEEVFHKMSRTMKNSMRYQQYPYNLLFNEIKEDRHDMDRLFDFSVNCYNMNLDTGLEEAEGKYVELYSGHQAIPLQIIYKVWNETEYSISIDYRKDCFKKQEVLNILEFIDYILDFYNTDNYITVEQIRKSIVKKSKGKYNHTYHVENMESKSFSELLSNIINCSENVTAVYLWDREISYGEFSILIENAINQFKDNNIGSGDKIIFFMENSLEYVVYILAAFIIRAVVIPLDAKMMKSQFEYIYDDCMADMVVTKSFHEYLGKCKTMKPVINLNIIGKKCLREYLAQYSDTSKNKTESAYAIYTSGTTGNPKGVLISRESIANYLNWGIKVYSKKKRTFFMFSSPSFDLSITTLLMPFVSGGNSVIDEKNGNIHLITKCKYAEKISALKATPSQLELLLAQDSKMIPLEVIISGGEELTTNLSARLRERFGSKLKIYNEYGPTEATIGCMCYIYNEKTDKGKTVPIGLPTPGTKIYLIDNGKEVFEHGIGEIYIQGVQLSSGYINLDKQNKDAFVTKEFTDAILYKTGDLAFWNANGQMEYLGRKERQNKVNGFRVELNLIENVIKNIDGIQNCMVLIDKEEEIEQIIAVVQTEYQSEANIYERLIMELPDYYIPHYIIITKYVPLTNNGKVDYSYIREFKRKLKNEKRDYKQDLNEILYQICEEVLKSNLPKDNYNYISAGGDSIKALLIITRLQKYGIILSLADILMHPLLSEMSKYAHKEELTYNDRISEKEEFKISDNIKLLYNTVDNFSSYKHVMIFEIKTVYSRNQITEAWTGLLNSYDILNYRLVDEKLIKSHNNSRDNLIFFESTNSNIKEFLISEMLKNIERDRYIIELNVASLEKRMILGFIMHHVLADGFTWQRVLENFADLLQGKSISIHSLVAFSEFSNEVIYEHGYELAKDEYRDYYSACRKVPFDDSESIGKTHVTEAVFKAFKNTEWSRNGEIWIESDARKFPSYRKFSNTLGCLAVFLPYCENKNSVLVENDYIKGRAINLKLTTGNVRLNYMGDLTQMVPKGFTILPESIELSLRQCGGFGCQAEITVYSIKKLTYVTVSTRNIEITDSDIDYFVDNIVDILQNSIADFIVLTDEELDIIFGE